MNVDHLTRQLTLIPMDTLGVKVNIIGCGAIGSFLALSLAKMGITRIEAWDFDEVSVENMSNQFFRFSDIGTPKVIALANLVKDFTGVDIKVNFEKFESAAGLTDIIVVAVDSMESRKNIFQSIMDNPHALKLIIDPRMSAEYFTMYGINPTIDKDREMYSKTLFTDGEAVQTACTAKSTVYTATLAAGMVVKTIKNFILDEPYPRNTQWDIKASTGGMEMFAGNVRPPTQGATLSQPAPGGPSISLPTLGTDNNHITYGSAATAYTITIPPGVTFATTSRDEIPF